MDDVHLDSFSFPMDDSNFSETFLLTFQEIFLQKGRDLLGGESVEVNPILDGNLYHHKLNVKFQNPKFKLKTLTRKVKVKSSGFLTKESIIEKTYSSENLPSPLFAKEG